jgi:hypothetical protein
MAAIVVGIVVAAAAQSASALQLTPLEEFSRRPTARMVWSQAIARIDSDESHAVVTAVVFDDSADPKGRMSGVRVDLVNATGSDQVYIAESAGTGPIGTRRNRNGYRCRTRSAIGYTISVFGSCSLLASERPTRTRVEPGVLHLTEFVGPLDLHVRSRRVQISES